MNKPKTESKLPQLAMAYGVGDLAEGGFNPGDMVLLPENLLLGTMGTEIPFVAIHAVHSWWENLTMEDGEAGKKPRKFPTEAEVHAIGRTTRWKGEGPVSKRPDFSQVVDLYILLKRTPEMLLSPEYFVRLATGYDYLLATFRCRKSAVTWAWAPIVKHMEDTGCAIWDRWCTLRSRVMGKGPFPSIPVPEVVPTIYEVAPELIAQIPELLKGQG